MESNYTTQSGFKTKWCHANKKREYIFSIQELDGLSSCSASLQELELSTRLKEMVFVRNLQCHE